VFLSNVNNGVDTAVYQYEPQSDPESGDFSSSSSLFIKLYQNLFSF